MENFEKPTDEQIAEFEKKMTDHYQKALPFLRLKAEHDMLQADISEARIRSLQANNQFAQVMVQQADEKKKRDEEAAAQKAGGE